jgi:hypothetical protein
MSVIAVFPLKTGYLMFVGFDSQNTSHFFHTIPIETCGFLELEERGHLSIRPIEGRRCFHVQVH